MGQGRVVVEEIATLLNDVTRGWVPKDFPLTPQDQVLAAQGGD